MSISYCISLFVKTYGKRPKVVSVYRVIYGFSYVFLIDGLYLLFPLGGGLYDWEVLSKEKVYSFVNCSNFYELSSTYDVVNDCFTFLKGHTALI